MIKHKKEVKQAMKLDQSLIMGIFIGVTVGLLYSGLLVGYLPFFIIGTVVLVLRYLHAR